MKGRLTALKNSQSLQTDNEITLKTQNIADNNDNINTWHASVHLG